MHSFTQTIQPEQEKGTLVSLGVMYGPDSEV